MGEAKQRKAARAAGRPWEVDKPRPVERGILIQPDTKRTDSCLAVMSESETVLVYSDLNAAVSESRRRQREFSMMMENVFRVDPVLFRYRPSASNTKNYNKKVR